MAEANSTRAIERNANSSLIDISHRINEIAAQISGIKPIAESLCDMSDDPGVGSSINLIGAMSGYINQALCEIAAQVMTLVDEGGAA